MITGKAINKYYKKYWYLFTIGFIDLIFIDFIQLFIPAIVGNAIEQIGRMIKPGGDNSFAEIALIIDSQTHWFKFNMGYVITVIAIIGTLITVGRIGWRLTINRVGNEIECDLRQELFDHVASLPVSWFAKEKTGGLMAYFTNDLEDVSASMSRGLIFLVDAVFLGIASIIFMFMTHWVLTALCMIPILAIIIAGMAIIKGETYRWGKSQQAFQNMSDVAQESISGLAVIKAFVREGREMERFAASNGKLRLANERYFRFSMLFSTTFINILIYATVLIILALGTYFAVTPGIVFPGIPAFDDGTMAAGLLAKFFGYLDTLVWPLMALPLLIDLNSRGKASLNRIGRILYTESDLRDESTLYKGPVKGVLECRNLTFSYPDDPNFVALKDITFKVEAGTRVGIVGRTGSGKSSLLTLLLKLYNVPQGMIFIDGRDINEWYGKALRKAFGFVTQDAFLFSDTIYDNIAFGVDKPSLESITTAAVFANVHSNILTLPDGYETLVGERGKSVSGGQRQRISLARAVIRDPAILFLDDSVSAVDAITEKEILANIKKRRGRTTFIISSRLSAVEGLDKIIVLDHGQMVGFGNHRELLKTCAVYQKLYSLQVLQKEMA